MKNLIFKGSPMRSKKKSIKKAIPLALVMSWGLLHVIYGIVKGFYGVPIAVYTYWNEFLIYAVPFSINLFLVSYSFYYSSSHRLVKTILLVLYLIDTVVMIMTFSEPIGYDKEAWAQIILHSGLTKYFWRNIMGGLKDFIEAILIGLSYWRSKPFFFEYKKVNPLQNILMKLNSVLIVGYGVLAYGITLLFAHYRGFF
jgi:hypothetical protein